MEHRFLVGLGNPGSDYADTRHNAGFRLIDLLRDRWSLGVPQDGGTYLYWQAKRGSHSVSLVKPLTYMNRSGQAVRQFASLHPFKIENLLVAYDDVSIPVGDIRLRANGSDGGQKGMRDLIAVLGTQEIPRLRLGVGGARLPGQSLADFVLGTFDAEELPQFERALFRAAEAIELWLESGFNDLMSRFNVRSAVLSKGDAVSDARGEE